MQDAEETSNVGEAPPSRARKPWSTPTVVLSTVRRTAIGPCSTTQSVGALEVKNPKSTPGTTSVHS